MPSLVLAAALGIFAGHVCGEPHTCPAASAECGYQTSPTRGASLLQHGSALRRSSLEAEARCRDAVPGEPCYNEVWWAMFHGMQTNPEWYSGLTRSSSFEEFQQLLHGLGKCPEAPCHVPEPGACRIAVEGRDPCFGAVEWAMSTGISTNPGWYQGLTPSSSFQEFQQALHDMGAAGGACPCAGPSCHEAVQGEPCYDEVKYAMFEGIVRRPERYPGLTRSSSFEEFQQFLHGLSKCPKPPCELPAPGACRIAVEGRDPCFAEVDWAMSTGIHRNPGWYPGATPSSSFREFQQVLHDIGAGGGVCPAPCGWGIVDDYELVWEDHFDGGAVNTTNWVVGSLRDPTSGDLVPGAVGDHLLNWGYQGYITEEDTYLEDGHLVLRNQKRPHAGASPAGQFQYTTGHVMSMHRVFLNKGYVEFRARFPRGPKVWPALWLVAEDLVWGPEWDMWEYFGWKDSQVGYDAMGMHLCHGTYPGVSWRTGWIEGYDSEYNSSAWHVYGFEWTDSAARWVIDGNTVRTLAREPAMEWPDEDMYLILNNGVKANSPDTATAWPNVLSIDYVKIYRRKSHQH